MNLFLNQWKENVKKYGSRPAIVDRDGTRETTYSELDALSGRICTALKKKGVGKGDIIPVCMERRMEFLAAELGILKSGAAFAALSPEYPKERVAYILKDCGAPFLLDDNFLEEASGEPLAEAEEVSGEDGAFAVYTSGSTGNPKGILHSHASLAAAVARHRAFFLPKESDVQLSCASFSFVAMMIDIYTPLSAGQSVHILPEEKRKDVRRIEQYIRQHGITMAFISPQMLRNFRSPGPSLRLVVTGSERVSRVKGSGYRLLNTYGCSETAAVVTAFEIEREYENTPIGKAGEGVRILLLDKEGNEVPAGEEGELCVEGHIAGGYINLPEQTNKAFVRREDGTMLFHTNDICRMLPDGNLEYLNRRDWMVKINGQRVETGEIEAQMSRAPFVKTAVVKGFQNQYGQTFLCGYFQMKEGAEKERPEEEIRRRLAETLPDYMIPKFFVRVEEFPLNQNGKLNRLALQAPDVSNFRKDYEEPQTECERAICRGFEQVLGIRPVGRRDDFFALGGDSIQAVMLLDCLEKYAVTAMDVFRHRTPEGIAAACGGTENAASKEDIYGDIPADRREWYPLTDSQMGVFLECAASPQSTMYNIPVCFRLPAGADPERWKEAAGRMASRYPALFVSIEMRQEEQTYGMAVHDTDGLSIPVYEAAEAEMDGLKREFVRPFDLEKGPLVRMAFYRTEESVYFLADMHHIISDGASVALFFDGVRKIYEGEEPEAEGISQFDLSLCEGRLKDTEAYKKAREYFEKRLAGLEVDSVPVFDMAENPEAPERPSGRITGCLGEILGQEETDWFAGKNGVTESTLFLGAFAYALAKYNGQTEVLFGSVNNGRRDLKLKRTIGMLVRTLPVYVQIQEEETVAEYLQKLQQDFFETMSHDCCSFEELAGRYQVTSDILFVYQSETLNGMHTKRGLIPMETLETGNSLANLAVHVFKKDGSYEIHLEYRSDVYLERTARTLLSLMVKALEGFRDCACLKDIPLVSAEDVAVLDSYHGKRTDYDRALTLPELFRRQAEKTPEHTAVVFREKRFSYREIDRLSDGVAAYVSRLGIGKDQTVSILISRGEYMPIASLGVMKAGAIYQPLDPEYPPERLSFMMEDAQTKLLIADEALLELVPGYNGQVLPTKEIPGLSAEGAKEIPAPLPEDTYILLYTSGTTGTPKGCMLSHGNLAAFCNWYCRYYRVGEDSVVSAYASYGFDANMMDTYPVLAGGGTLCIVPEEMRLELQKLNEYLIQEKVTHAFMTTQVGRQFALEMENHCLKYLLTGGETLVPVRVKSGFDFYNCYGPTECTILTTVYPVDKAREYDNVPIGRPLDNLEVYVVDKQMRRLPAGAVGELCVAGYQVSKGYLNRPEQTAKVYTPNCFTDREGYERVYHTGDDVRFLPDGNIQFMGRRDGQVKIRGFRIELSEVEAVIRRFPGICDVTVTAYEAAAGGKAIAAYLVSETPVDIQKLRDFIMEEKPAYMVPSAIMQIDRIPLNQNMKVDKRSLPTPVTQEETCREAARPMSLLEEELAQIAGKILGHEEFSVETNLLYAGLTSLSAIMLAVEIEKEYGVELEVKQMMRQCSILSLENAVYQALRARSGAEESRERAEESQEKAGEKVQTEAEDYPLTQTQLGVYYDAVKRPEDMAYNIPAMFRFPRKVSGETLAKAAEQVIAAHPYVNARIRYREGELRQMPGAESAAEKRIPVLSMTEEELKEYCASYVKPFDLTRDTLYRIGVVQTGTSTCLLADFHHIIFDGASLNLFLEQTAKACEGVLPEKETRTYFDFALQEHRLEGGEHYREGQAFFGKMLGEYEHASCLTPDLAGKEEDGKKAECAASCSGEEMDKFCQAHGVTPAHLFLAGTFYTLARYMDSPQLFISTISNGRADLKLHNSMGMFVKTLPLMGNIAGDKSVLTFVKEVRQTLLDAVSYEDYPFTKIAADYGFVPEIMYACQLGVVEEHRVGSEAVQIENMESDKPKFKLSVHIEERDGGPCVCLQYNDALYSRELMEQLAQSVALCVSRMLANPSGLLKEISLVTDNQRRMLEEFAVSAQTGTEPLSFHGVFERQAAACKEKTALIAVDGRWSYEGLDREMNRAANGLISRGFCPGDTAVVLLPRLGRQIIAMYGVMKAGGAYIPCDPEYPPERILQITKDSGASFIITTKERAEAFENAIDMEALLSCGDDRKPEIKTEEDALAYLIYTSGSTGKPKGVMISHRGIVNYVRNHEANSHVRACVEDGHVMVSVTTVSFDMSLKETAVALCNGLTLVLADEEQANHPVRLAELIEETGGDIFNATPSRMLQYMESGTFCRALSGCRVVMSGGEAYSMQLLEKLKQVTCARIFNTYGPTEITVSCNACELTDRDRITVGRPLLNYVEYIADSDGNLLPPGVTGELYVGGPGVAAGYHGLPEMTAERFVQFQGMRVYKTGDYAKWTRSGEVVILGRTDNQVKLRGLRIELEEVEQAILRCPGIRQTVVLIRGIEGTEHLCAYYTAEEAVLPETLREQLKNSLTRYMIPDAYRQMERFPMTPNGKIDQKALPEAQLAGAGEYVEPQTETERTFCRIFAEVLHLDRVGREDDFFEIGGTSLAVTGVIIAATEEGFEITFGDVFSHATPRDLAEMFREENVQISSKLEDLSQYDYKNIERVLERNTFEEFLEGEAQPLGNILLTGATGFLGIHILREFLESESGKVYCLLRRGRFGSVEERLKSLLFYYFENTYEELLRTRLYAVEGDVTDAAVFERMAEASLDIHTVVNCAANVKHFSAGTDIEDVNVGGVLNAIAFCEKTKSRLLHISTTSVSGFSVGDVPFADTVMNERMLYFGQALDTKYGHSKFLAERAVLEAVSRGLNAKIMRVGNLSARDADGEFQMNFSTNSFVGRLKSYELIGRFPYSMMDSAAEMAPIDCTAKAILTLAATPEACCVFHPYNNHSIYMGDIIYAMKEYGMDIELSEDEDYERALEETRQDPEKAKVLSSMIAYQNMGHGKKTVGIAKENAYTMKVLYRLGYHWPTTSREYVGKLVAALDGLGFFKEQERDK